MKRVTPLFIAAGLLAAPALSSAQDARALQASKLIQLAVIVLAADRNARVNVNRDSAGQISRAIPELTPDIANNIVAYRTRNGRFTSLLDLLQVPGVSRDMVTRHRRHIVL